MTHLDGREVTGAVLVGGRSRRMGQSKSVLRVPEDGPTMVERAVCHLQGCCDHVFLVGTDTSVIPDSLADLSMVIDPGEGPAGGLVAAMRATEHARVLLTGCDLPFLPPDVLRLVIGRSTETRRGAYPVTIRDDGSEQIQPLAAVYLRDQLEEAIRLFELGVRSLTGMVTGLGMLRVDSDQFAHLGYGSWSFFNVNTPGDLQLARDHAREAEKTAGGILGGECAGT